MYEDIKGSVLENTDSLKVLKSNYKKKHFIIYFLQIKKLKSINTYLSYERDIKTFFNVQCIEDITISDVVNVNNIHAEQYIIFLKNKGYASSTINRKISSLSSLYKWILKYRDNVGDKSIIKYNPFEYLNNEKPTVICEEAEFLTKEECKYLVESIDTSTVIGLRDKTIMCLALTTALRKSEMINIKLKDITTYGEYNIIYIIRKGGKKDMIKLQPKVHTLINSYIERSNRDWTINAEDHLFIGHSVNNLNSNRLNHNTINLVLKRVCKNAGITKKLRVHSTRHTAITMVINEGASIEKVRDFAGHANIATTNRYLHSVDKIKNNPGDLIDII